VRSHTCPRHALRVYHVVVDKNVLLHRNIVFVVQQQHATFFVVVVESACVVVEKWAIVEPMQTTQRNKAKFAYINNIERFST
jgi:hypothetical protein